MEKAEIVSSDENPVEGAWIMKITNTVGLDGKTMKLVQKSTAEEASSKQKMYTFAHSL